ncbi:MAG: hypothetical protein QXK12_00650 [Candidatus Nezhaarchaeales archaeon]
MIFYLALRQPHWTWDGFFTAPTWFTFSLTVFGVICGLAVLIGVYRLYKGRNVSGGVLVILFSTLSLLIGGGFIIGFILGVVGGAFAIAGI